MANTDKKRKRDTEEPVEGGEDKIPTEGKKKNKKRGGKKVQQKKARAAQGEKNESGDGEESPNKTKSPGVKNGKKRFSVFVGNLSFKTKKEALEKCFSKCGSMTQVRMLTEKGTNKPRGIAFVDFEDADSLKKALMFHKYSLDGREINVELTAGGGGKGDARSTKLKEKNEALNKERESWDLNKERPDANEKDGEEQPKKRKRGIKKGARSATGSNFTPIGGKKE